MHEKLTDTQQKCSKISSKMCMQKLIQTAFMWCELALNQEYLNVEKSDQGSIEVGTQILIFIKFYLLFIFYLKMIPNKRMHQSYKAGNIYNYIHSNVS